MGFVFQELKAGIYKILAFYNVWDGFFLKAIRSESSQGWFVDYKFKID